MAGKAGGKASGSAHAGETEYGLRILFSLRKIIRAVDIHSHEVAAEFGITGPQLACLLAVVEKGSTTATEIAERISLSASTIIGILDRLEGKELLRRERDNKDRRVIHVLPTEKGRELAAKMPFPLKRPLNKALGKMSETEQKKTAEILEKLESHMSADNIGSGPLLEIGVIKSRIEG